MSSFQFEYQSTFARHCFTQGKVEGRLEMVLKLLASRFGPLTEIICAHVCSADGAQIDAMADRMLTAQTLEDVLGPLPPTLPPILVSCSAVNSEAIDATTNFLGDERLSGLARCFLGKGRTEIILRQLASRFGPLTQAVRVRVYSIDSSQFQGMAERMLTARTLDEVLGPDTSDEEDFLASD